MLETRKERRARTERLARRPIIGRQPADDDGVTTQAHHDHLFHGDAVADTTACEQHLCVTSASESAHNTTMTTIFSPIVVTTVFLYQRRNRA